MTDLITLAEYKVLKKISASNPDNDIQLSRLITAVSAFIETYCNRTFLTHFTTPAIEYYDNFYSATMVQLDNFPVVEIISVEERALSESSYTATTDYRLDSTTDSIFKVLDGRYAIWADGPQAIKVTYKYGYSSIPEELKLAIADFVHYYAANEYKPTQSIGSNVLTGAPSFSTTNLAELPGHIKRVLDLYKNVG